MVQTEKNTSRYHIKKQDKKNPVSRKTNKSDLIKLKDVLSLTNEKSSDESYKYLISEFMDILEKSNVFMSLCEEIEKLPWKIGFEDLGNRGHCLDFSKSVIKLDQHGLLPTSLRDSDYFFQASLLSFVRGLRDLWQEQRWPEIHEYYGPEALMFLERLKAADNDVFALMILWELKDNGYDRLWRHMISSDDADMAKCFANTQGCLLEKASKAFRAWFESAERIRCVDHESLEYMDSLIEDNKKAPFGCNKLVARDIVRVACLPNRTSYLNGMGHDIIQDPFYSGLQDPINQAHFFHLIRDAQCLTVQGVQFRDPSLARKMFPEQKVLQD